MMQMSSQPQPKPPKGVTYSNLNAFKTEEKRYKYYKGHKTDFSRLLDLETLTNERLEEEQISKTIQDGKAVFRFSDPEGVIVVKQFMQLNEQVEFATKCLNDFILKPYRTNLFIYDQNQTNYEKEKYLVNDYHKYYFDKKIRWSNVGYQYDWDNRKYPEHKTPIPLEISDLADRANALLSLQPVYNPESIIINYYSQTDYMTGHLDDAELDQESPIYSFSLGLSSVFLIGGLNKETVPKAIKLDSGDLLVMSGFSRRCYHGVPRVLELSFKHKNVYWQNKHIIIRNEDLGQEVIQKQKQNVKEFQNLPFHTFNYLFENRINLNIRQVNQIF